ncbi:hypothetical protein BH18ACT5_BH18ACT5_07960 [soil metagenome]
MEGWFFVTAALLAVSGIRKVVDPAPTSGALRAAGLPHRSTLVLGLGVFEVGVGASNLLVSNSVLVWAQAALYAAFAVFVLWALRQRIPIASCGCFGKPDTPPTRLHVVVNVAALVGASVHALTETPSLASVLGSQPLVGVPYLGFVALGTYCLYLLLGELPLLRTNA